jgi:hypothetical protein
MCEECWIVCQSQDQKARYSLGGERSFRRGLWCPKVMPWLQDRFKPKSDDIVYFVPCSSHLVGQLDRSCIPGLGSLLGVE